ncbi:hypothetical protein [Mesorhizobium sp. WSM4308]|uniref:hypothetical protein n=1 Tax=Mesorhizobium sp. WSM4308 TaxID=2029409 RepID=UPI00117FA3ED|nr:hypothetical protein [Mesorhizobium sp. WSM4308]
MSTPDSNGWHDISTAHKDGSWMFLYWPTMSITSFPQVGFHMGDEYGWELANDRDYGEVFPTHWRPMFAPPVSHSSSPPPPPMTKPAACPPLAAGTISEGDA